MKKEKRRKRFLFLILLLLVLLFGVYLGAKWIGSRSGEADSGISLEIDPNADDWDLSPLEGSGSAGQDNIAIPGYGQFTFRAGVEDQRVDLGTPKGIPVTSGLSFFWRTVRSSTPLSWCLRERASKRSA